MTVEADIGASSCDSFPGDPLSSLASPFLLETQDSFAIQFPELTSPSHTDFHFPPVPLAASESSSNSSTVFAETSATGPPSKEPPLGFQQDTQDEGIITSLKVNGRGPRIPTPEPASRSPAMAPPDRFSCQECPKRFSRRHELQYVTIILTFVFPTRRTLTAVRLANMLRLIIETFLALIGHVIGSSTVLEMLIATSLPATAPEKKRTFFYVSSEIANTPPKDSLGTIIFCDMFDYSTKGDRAGAASRVGVWTSNSKTSSNGSTILVRGVRSSLRKYFATISENYMTVCLALAPLM